MLVAGTIALAACLSQTAHAVILYEETFNYGDPSGSRVVSNFHGWYLGSSTSFNSTIPDEALVFQTGSVPGFNSNGYITWTSSQAGYTYKYASDPLPSPITLSTLQSLDNGTNSILTLDFKIRTGSTVDLIYYTQGVLLPNDMAVDSNDRGLATWTYDLNQPSGVQFIDQTTNIVSETGYYFYNLRTGPVPYQWTTDTTYNVKYSMDFVTHNAMLQVRSFDDNATTWNPWTTIHGWTYAPLSWADQGLSSINGVGVVLQQDFSSAAMKVSDIYLYTGMQIPEPTTAGLALLALAGLLGRRQTRN